MIGGGLALNDTRFILVQATCPTSTLSQSVTLFLSLGVEFAMGIQIEGVKWGAQEVQLDSGLKDRG